jgi:phosphoglycolate phosphatase-like HAD superfamily hydrolase
MHLLQRNAEVVISTPIFLINLDGVLLNAETDIVSCLNTALGEFGISEIPVDWYREHWGMPLVQLVQDFTETPLLQTGQIVARYVEVCEERGFVQTEVIHDTHSLLRELHALNYPLASLSSYISNPESLLREKGIDKYFSAHYATMGDRGALIDRACLEGGCNWILSDRITDIQHGISIETIDTAAITWGWNSTWDLGVLTPDLVIETAFDLKQYFVQKKPTWAWK